MIVTVDTSRRRRVPLTDLTRAWHRRLLRRRPAPDDAAPGTETVLVRALCHDMGGALSCLRSALGHVHDDGATDPEMLALARAQADYLASMLRTARATAAAGPSPAAGFRMLPDVLAASVAASGLPPAQLTLRMNTGTGEVAVGDAGLQRILTNLLENAHRHGAGAPVRLTIARRTGWVEFAVAQTAVAAGSVLAHLSATTPPADLTGLGLWSVQCQAHALGGHVIGEFDRGALTVRVLLPDR